MFIDFLDKEEKEVFYSLALDLVKIDDDFSDKEKEKIRILSFRALSEEGYDVDHLHTDVATLENFSKKKIVLTELVLLSYIDGNYCDKEKEFIHNLAERLQVEKSVIDEIETWALGYIQQVNKGVSLINKV